MLTFYQSADIFQTGPRILKLTVAGQSRQYTYQPAPDEWENVKKMRWIARSFVFTATGKTTTLEFDSVLSAGGAGSLIDNVQVRALQPASSPPPASVTGTPASVPPAATPVSTPPTATPDRVSPAAPVPGITFGTAVIPSGGQQTLQVTATPNAPVQVLIDYPDRTQSAVHGQADADGRYTYSWIVSASLWGPVHVRVEAAGARAAGSFAIS